MDGEVLERKRQREIKLKHPNLAISVVIIQYHPTSGLCRLAATRFAIRTLFRYHLKGEVNVLRALMYATRADDINIVAHIVGHVVLRQAAGDLDEILASAPSLLEIPRGGRNSRRREIVKHDDIGAGLDGRISFFLALTLNLDLDREPRSGLCSGHGGSDTAATRPDVIVLEHSHRAEVLSVRITAPDQHAVLLHQPEPWRRLARAGQRILIPCLPEQRQQRM